MIRIRFGAHYSYNLELNYKKEPQTSIGNYLGPYRKAESCPGHAPKAGAPFACFHIQGRNV